MPSPGSNTVTTGANAPVSAAGPVIQVYNPAAVGVPHAVIFNNGASAAYLGGSAVTALSGMWFPPGAQLSLPFAPYAIFAIDSATVGAPVSSLTAAVASGGTTIILAGTATTGIVPSTGQIFAVGSGTALEYVTVATYKAGVANGTVTTTGPFLYDHAVNATAQTITAQSATSLSVNTGTT